MSCAGTREKNCLVMKKNCTCIALADVGISLAHVVREIIEPKVHNDCSYRRYNAVYFLVHFNIV